MNNQLSGKQLQHEFRLGKEAQQLLEQAMDKLGLSARAYHRILRVARLKSAGAVVAGKTNVPVFTMAGYTSNELFGITGNPWNPELIPNGSSGGAVGSVATGIVPLAIGTDGGGSIRRPAAYSGLVGLKPTIGRILRIGGFPQLLLDFEVVGGMARTVKDAWLLFRLMAGPDERIQNSLNLPTMSMGRDLDVPPPRLRILYVERFGEALLDPGIAESCGDAVRVLEHLGHDVREGCLPVDIIRFMPSGRQ